MAKKKKILDNKKMISKILVMLRSNPGDLSTEQMGVFSQTLIGLQLGRIADALETKREKVK